MYWQSPPVKNHHEGVCSILALMTHFNKEECSSWGTWAFLVRGYEKGLIGFRHILSDFEESLRNGTLLRVGYSQESRCNVMFEILKILI